MIKVTAYGRIATDINYKVTTGEKATAIANFNIAVNRRFKRDGEPDADFFRCSAFGKTAETINKFFSKGSRICISGRLQTNSYTTQSGEKRTSTDIIVEEIDFVDTKAESEAKGNTASTSTTKDHGFVNVPEGADDELPFN